MSRNRDACYLRVSESEDINRSMQGQRAAVCSHLVKLGRDPEAALWFIDDDVSGMISIMQRADGRRCIEAAQRGEFGTLYVWEVSRLARKLLYGLEAHDLLEQAGVKLRSTTESFADDDAGTFIMQILMANAEMNRKTLLKTTRKGVDQCAVAGYHLGGRCTYGYEIVPDLHVKQRLRMVVCRKPIPDHPDWTPADVIQIAFDRCVQHRETCGQIGKYLQSLGLPTFWTPGDRYGSEPLYGVWTANRVRALLVNATYMGVHYFGQGKSKTEPAKRGEPVARACEAIVSEETWTEAQRVLQRNFTLCKRNNKREYLLRSMVRCGTCGRKYIGTGQIGPMRDVDDRFYVCIGKKQPDARGTYCRASQWVWADELEQMVKDRISVILLQPGQVMEEVRTQAHQAGDQVDDYRVRLAAVEKELAGLTRQRDEYLRLRVTGMIKSDGDLQRHLTGLDEQEAALATKARQWQEKIEGAKTLDADLRRLEETLAHYEEEGRPMNEADWREYAERFIASITIHTTGEGYRKQATAAITTRLEPTETFTVAGSHICWFNPWQRGDC